MADNDVELEDTDGVTLEMYTIEEKTSLHNLVKTFAAYMPKKHAHGQWLICDFQTHEMSNNKRWKGFQKIFRMRYKPTKFAYKHTMIMSSSNDTDSPEETWAHAMDILRLVCHDDVYVYHAHVEKKKRMARSKR